MDKSPWCDEEMCPQEGHSMPGGDEGVSRVLIFSSVWCSAIVHGLLCALVSPRGRYLKHIHFTQGGTTLDSLLACLLFPTSVFCWLGTVIHRWVIQLRATPTMGSCVCVCVCSSMPDPKIVDTCPDVARQAFFETEPPPSWLSSSSRFTCNPL